MTVMVYTCRTLHLVTFCYRSCSLEYHVVSLGFWQRDNEEMNKDTRNHDEESASQHQQPCVRPRGYIDNRISVPRMNALNIHVAGRCAECGNLSIDANKCSNLAANAPDLLL